MISKRDHWVFNQETEEGNQRYMGQVKENQNTDRTTEFYRGYHDSIRAKRHNSPRWIRRYTHRTLHQRLLNHVKPGDVVLDAGCGEGLLAIDMARLGAYVTAIDLSEPNIEAAKEIAAEAGVSVDFRTGDAMHLPFDDNSFDLVISSHVIEHLPDPARGIREVNRVTRDRAVIAMPTCLNPACWAMMGGADFWGPTRKVPVGLVKGTIRTFIAFVRGEDGPYEDYAGYEGIPHVWRFPWVVTRMVRQGGFVIEKYEPGPIVIPYLGLFAWPGRFIQRTIDRLPQVFPFKYFGYGSQLVCRKLPNEDPR